MQREVEDLMLAKAKARHLIDSDVLRTIDQEVAGARLSPRPGGFGPRVELLIRQGKIDRKQAEALSAEALLELLGTDFAVDVVGPPSQLPAFGRYQNLMFEARGGMADVYKAFDPSLDRTV